MIRLGDDAVILTAEEVNCICRVLPAMLSPKPKSKESSADFYKRCITHNALSAITDLQQCDRSFQRDSYDD